MLIGFIKQPVINKICRNKNDRLMNENELNWK